MKAAKKWEVLFKIALGILAAQMFYIMLDSYNTGIDPVEIMFRFYNLPSLIITCLGIVFTGVIFPLKDALKIMFYPFYFRNKIRENRNYYWLVLKALKKNVWYFGASGTLLGFLQILFHPEFKWQIILSGVGVAVLTLFYALLMTIFIFNPVMSMLEKEKAQVNTNEQDLLPRGLYRKPYSVMLEVPMKVFYYLFAVMFIFISITARSGGISLNELMNFLDTTSIIITVLGLTMTAAAYPLKDIIKMLLYPVFRKKVRENREYYGRLLKTLKNNVWCFGAFGTLFGFIRMANSNVPDIKIISAGVGVSLLCIFYALLLNMLVFNPVSYILKNEQQELKKNEIPKDGID